MKNRMIIRLCYFFIIIFQSLSAQKFTFSNLTPITDGKPETTSEFHSNQEIILKFEVYKEGYEGNLHQLIISFVNNVQNPLPQKINLKVTYDITLNLEEEEITKTFICVDTMVVIKDKKFIFNFFDECYLSNGELKLSFYPWQNTKYRIQDIEIIGKDFRIYEQPDEKPVVYLYPTQIINLNIHHLNCHKFTFSYPKYSNEWKFRVYPNGNIEDEHGKQYPYLFWEGKSNIKTSFTMGFCVKRDSIVPFLEEKLAYQGLNFREITDFITYWAPRMQYAPYYLIYFGNQEFEQEYPIKVLPSPDTQIRVFMIARPSETFMHLKEQPLPKWERNGFTYVEWGGKLLE